MEKEVRGSGEYMKEFSMEEQVEKVDWKKKRKWKRWIMQWGKES
jgi:hypothetical protein